ncbi:retinoid-binding protein 7 isoform X3 [Bos taurus]|nr:retinoid-binding protein 7 isoform X3 [Bos taurus]
MLKPQKVIEQNGDSFTIHTNSTFRNYVVKFKVGEEFDEDNKGVDNRKCKSLVTWDNDRLTCVQKGEKKNRGWTHWIEGDQLHLSTSCEMLGWMNHKLESRLLAEIINNLRYADATTLMSESEEELKGLLMRVKEESEKLA